MGFVWIEKPPKGKPALEKVTTSSVEMTAFKPVKVTSVLVAVPASSKTPTNTDKYIVRYVKAALCTKCGFHEEAEEDFVMFHCGMSQCTCRFVCSADFYSQTRR